jgi:hypothetical protein
VEAESYPRFRIHGDAIAQCGTITPEADGTQHDLVFGGATTLQDEGAMHMPVCSHNKAHPHIQPVVLHMQEWVGSEQGLGGLHISTSRQCHQWRRHGRKLGDVSWRAAPNPLQLGEGNVVRDCGRGYGTPGQQATAHPEDCRQSSTVRRFRARPETLHSACKAQSACQDS